MSPDSRKITGINSIPVIKNDLNKLKKEYKNNPYIQGGICRDDTTLMYIYNENDSLIIKVTK